MTHEWIDCKKKMPAADSVVLVYDGVNIYTAEYVMCCSEADMLSGGKKAMRFRSNAWSDYTSGWDADYETIDATHWMELPKDPTSDNSDYEAALNKIFDDLDDDYGQETAQAYRNCLISKIKSLNASHNLERCAKLRG